MFQCFVFFFIFAFSCLGFSSLPLLDILKPKSGPLNEVVTKAEIDTELESGNAIRAFLQTRGPQYWIKLLGPEVQDFLSSAEPGFGNFIGRAPLPPSTSTG